MSDYKGKVAVVTGAASGIGYAVAARNPGDDSVDPNFRRSTGRDPS